MRSFKRSLFFGAATCVLLAAGACGGSSPKTTNASAAGSTAASETATTPVTPDPVTPVAAVTTTSAAAPATATRPLLDGVYALTGTGTCKGTSASTPAVAVPIAGDSSMTVRGDLATVKLLDTHDAPVVLTGTSFQISRTFDLNGDPVPPGSPPSPNDLPFEIHGTSPDGGQTFTATGIDAGVNCEYVLSGRRSSGPASTTVKPATGDPCDHIAVAGFGPVRVISNCELPWAAASFVPGPPRQVLVHWSGTQWEPFDEKAFCATYTGVKPSQAVNEGQPGRIWIEYCRPKSTPTTGPVAPTTVPAAPSAAPCTRAAVQAALPPGKTVASDPHCDGDWAVSSYSKGDDTGDLGLLLQAASGRWQVVNQPTACSSGKIPASLYDEGCRSG